MLCQENNLEVVLEKMEMTAGATNNTGIDESKTKILVGSKQTQALFVERGHHSRTLVSGLRGMESQKY